MVRPDGARRTSLGAPYRNRLLDRLGGSDELPASRVLCAELGHDEMDVFEVKAIGVVRGGRDLPEDDSWEVVSAEIELDPSQFNAEALLGLDQFSHAEIVFVFNRVGPDDITYDARRPRNRADWPRVGIFAQRGRNRPNRIGVSVCRIIRVSGLTLRVQGLDAIDGTPVLDIKPVMAGFRPRGDVKEPEWAREIMERYWR
jgi:tRNA-Thr(GGU) m(6)t(6)A37 methyltransferase TsaA